MQALPPRMDVRSPMEKTCSLSSQNAPHCRCSTAVVVNLRQPATAILPYRHFPDTRRSSPAASSLKMQEVKALRHLRLQHWLMLFRGKPNVSGPVDCPQVESAAPKSMPHTP